MKPPPVTDHAVLRYLERVKGMDVNALRAEIAALIGATPEQPPRRSRVVEGFLYHVRDGVVVTVMEAHGRLRGLKRLRHELREGDTREPGTRPVTEADPWWYVASAGPDGGASGA